MRAESGRSSATRISQALSIGITVYAFWPSLGDRFDKAAKSILDDEDGPAKGDAADPEDAPCR